MCNAGRCRPSPRHDALREGSLHGTHAPAGLRPPWETWSEGSALFTTDLKLQNSSFPRLRFRSSGGAGNEKPLRSVSSGGVRNTELSGLRYKPPPRESARASPFSAAGRPTVVCAEMKASPLFMVSLVNPHRATIAPRRARCMIFDRGEVKAKAISFSNLQTVRDPTRRRCERGRCRRR